MNVGIITYDCAHLKTEQLVCRYMQDQRVKNIEIYSLPFIKREKRPVAIQHRPDMELGLFTHELSELGKVRYHDWDGKKVLGNYCDFFVIGGAGILDVAFAEGKPIINAHPGIIPLTRGLDSFKWAIYNGDPLGVTLHLIDEEVDKGTILSVQRTPVFSSDSLQMLARRHYELEITMLGNCMDFLDGSLDSLTEEKPVGRRMSKTIEAQMIHKFDGWKGNFACKSTRNSSG
ncbi:formyltransferase family protein [Litorivicinus sp.]|nr:formyltransferase family protein [Litorivicinus sp.]MDC1239997.1 formyltransferase family protein [Litorivicinus sp.]